MFCLPCGNTHKFASTNSLLVAAIGGKREGVAPLGGDARNMDLFKIRICLHNSCHACSTSISQNHVCKCLIDNAIAHGVEVVEGKNDFLKEARTRACVGKEGRGWQK